MTESDAIRLADVARIVAVQLGLPGAAAEDRIVTDLGAESFDVVNIVAAVEDRYRIAIAEEALFDTHTVGDLYELARGLLAGRAR